MNDTAVVSQRLAEAGGDDQRVLDVFALIRGPYAFVYWQVFPQWDDCAF
jgi:hypothetical protein